jgi:hypothetical protein
LRFADNDALPTRVERIFKRGGDLSLRDLLAWVAGC